MRPVFRMAVVLAIVGSPVASTNFSIEHSRFCCQNIHFLKAYISCYLRSVTKVNRQGKYGHVLEGTCQRRRQSGRIHDELGQHPEKDHDLVKIAGKTRVTFSPVLSRMNAGWCSHKPYCSLMLRTTDFQSIFLERCSRIAVTIHSDYAKLVDLERIMSMLLPFSRLGALLQNKS